MILCETPPWVGFSRREKSYLQNIRCHFSTLWIVSLINALLSLVNLYAFFHKGKQDLKEQCQEQSLFNLNVIFAIQNTFSTSSISVSEEHTQPALSVCLNIEGPQMNICIFFSSSSPTFSCIYPISGSSQQTIPHPSHGILLYVNALVFSVQ